MSDGSPRMGGQQWEEHEDTKGEQVGEQVFNRGAGNVMGGCVIIEEMGGAGSEGGKWK